MIRMARWGKERITVAWDRVSGAISAWPSQFRLMFLSILIGCIAGLGAIFFDRLLAFTLDVMIHPHTGYGEPARGATATVVAAMASVHSFWFLVIPALGGLASGLIVYSLAPEAEGHGTDAMIESFHLLGGKIRKRVPLIKVIASALTIGSGGSAGKEGPIAQIGSGFGSIFASVLKLKPRERRILVLAGAAGGLGAIFQAPLGAALFAPEVLYRETDFEHEAILPCVVSSIIAYAVYTQFYKGGALFFPGPVDFSLPTELLPYAVFGVVCALVGYVYVKIFYGARDRFFTPLRISRMIKPALGGLMLGAIAFFYPQVTNVGYGWVQMALEGKIFWGTMLLLVFLKIAATSCTISSGGSGGVFGPSVFIGAMLGGAFGFLGHKIAPGWVIHPNSFVLVGIGGFFAGVAKVPIASIIMACEMSASYTLLVPLMLVSSISYLLLRNTNLYEKQQISRFASPAHLTEIARGMLERIQVREAVHTQPITLIPETMPFGDLVRTVSRSGDSHFPVVDPAGRIIGIVSVNDIRSVLFENDVDQVIIAKDVATRGVVSVFRDDTLQQALEKMAAIGVDELPVVDREKPDEIVAMISKRDIVNYYYDKSSG
ncbi:MAG: Cl-channel voltage-gated family protein [Deltaproteobacteria bacterium]|nr:Cl-channel voltage-gated family protein [Deltaproteobacteria bacterium]